MSDKIDGYWLRMGYLAHDAMRDAGTLVEAISESPERVTVLAEYLGGMFEQAHEMGLRLGEARGRYLVASKRAEFPPPSQL